MVSHHPAIAGLGQGLCCMPKHFCSVEVHTWVGMMRPARMRLAGPTAIHALQSWRWLQSPARSKMLHLGLVSESRDWHERTGRFNVQSSRVSMGGSWPETTERAAGFERGKHSYRKWWTLKGARKFGWINKAYIKALNHSVAGKELRKERILLCNRNATVSIDANRHEWDPDI